MKEHKTARGFRLAWVFRLGALVLAMLLVLPALGACNDDKTSFEKGY